MPAGVERIKRGVVLHDVCCVLARLWTDHVWLLCQYVAVVCLPVILVGAVSSSFGSGSEH